MTGHIRFGWVVQPLIDGDGRTVAALRERRRQARRYTWDGKTAAGAAAPDGTYRITIWTADASDNRASVSKVVTIDRRAAGLTLAASSSYISPNGDRHADQTTLAWATDERISGTARLFARDNATVRRWTIAGATAGSWTWNGKNTAGADRRGRPLHVAAGRPRPRRQPDHARPAGPRRPDDPVARLGALVVHARERARRIASRSSCGARRRSPSPSTRARPWSDGSGRAVPSAAGTYGWTWNGRTAAGALVKPGSYKVVVDATSRIGPSRDRPQRHRPGPVARPL